MSKKVYRGGVFGFGGVGQGLTGNINVRKWYGDDAKIVGACNRGEPNRKVAEERFGLKAFKDPRDLIKMGLDFGIVSSTTVAHFEHVSLLAEQGIPIFCEKPITLTLDEGREMVRIVKKAGIPTVVNFGPRMAPANLKIKSMIDKGDFGKLLSQSSIVHRGHGFYEEGKRHRAAVEPEESGGWAVHHACHQVSVQCWFLGEVESVSVVSSSTVPKEIQSDKGLLSEEVVIARLKFKNGAYGQIYDSVGGVRAANHLSLVGTKCAVTTSHAGETGVLICHYAGEKEWGSGSLRIIDPNREFPLEDNIHHFIKIVRGETDKSKITIEDAYESLRVTFAMRESARKNGEVVSMEAYQ